MILILKQSHALNRAIRSPKKLVTTHLTTVETTCGPVDINANNIKSSTGVTVHLIFTLELTINAYVTVQQVCG
jgi:hypothetical protein